MSSAFVCRAISSIASVAASPASDQPSNAATITRAGREVRPVKDGLYFANQPRKLWSIPENSDISSIRYVHNTLLFYTSQQLQSVTPLFADTWRFLRCCYKSYLCYISCTSLWPKSFARIDA